MTARTVRVGDVDIPRVGLGTNRLTNTPANAGFLQAALAAGVRMIDTARIYTGGDSERVIGETLASRPSGCIVATKGGFAAGEGRPDVLRSQIDESLRRLRTETIDLYYLHRVDPETPLEESLGAIRDAQAAGKVRHAGISAVTVEQIERARRVLEVTAVQNHYNIAERGSDAVVDHCTEHGILFVPYYPLRETHPALDRIARQHRATPAQISLAWLLRRSPVVLPIPGTLSADHVRENVGALDIELTDEEFAELQRAA